MDVYRVTTLEKAHIESSVLTVYSEWNSLQHFILNYVLKFK